MLPDETDFHLPEEEQAEPAVLAAEIEQQSAPSEPFWTYKDLALVAGLLVASIALILLIVGVLAYYNPKLQSDQAILIFPTQFALYGLIYLSFRIVFGLRYGKPVLASLGWKRTNFQLWMAAVGGLILALAVGALAAALHTPKVDSPMEKLAETPWSFALLAILATTFAPLFEEMLFRGFLQPLFSRTFGVIAGVIATAVLFGALHAPEYAWAWQYALAVAIAGVVFGWLRARTNSIIPSTVMHGCYNAFFVLGLALERYKLIS